MDRRDAKLERLRALVDADIERQKDRNGDGAVTDGAAENPRMPVDSRTAGP
jgi:hypothetical protein